MAIAEGSLILVEYTAKVKNEGIIIETTKGGVGAYKPKLVSVGDPSHPVLRGFNAALARAEVGVAQSVEVPPAEAYGESSRAKIKIVTHRKLGEKAEDASVGDTVEVDGRKGVVRFMGSGRVQVDFNHRYAGRTVLYDFTVVKRLESAEEKVEALIKEALGEAVEYELDEDGLEVDISEGLAKKDDIQRKKLILQREIFQFVPDILEVCFVETYKNPAAPTF